MTCIDTCVLSSLCQSWASKVSERICHDTTQQSGGTCAETPEYLYI